MQKKILTLCLVHDDTRILLGMKKRGFGAGRWNGFGGKVEAHETVEEAAHRELLEEAGITVPSLTKRAVLTFSFANDPVMLETHLFSSSAFEGDPSESDEMRPQWFSHEDIPFADMWPDDKHWMPLFLAGKRFTGHFSFDEHQALISHTLQEVDDMRLA